MKDALLILAAIGGYCLFVLAVPHGRCWRCRGRRRSRRWLFGLAGPLGKCRPCRATGRRRRLAAVAIHRFFWSAVGNRILERRREQRQEGGQS
jgi:hypothetical protein